MKSSLTRTLHFKGDRDRKVGSVEDALSHCSGLHIIPSFGVTHILKPEVRVFGHREDMFQILVGLFL